jgi:hypothetical protein
MKISNHYFKIFLKENHIFSTLISLFYKFRIGPEAH